MGASAPIFSYGSLLIESPCRENEEQFHAYLTELLDEIYGRRPEWLKFDIGHCYEREGIFYREFLCPAGSVDSNIQLYAQRPGGISRRIIIRGKKGSATYCCEINLGFENRFDCSELQKVT
jgi:hypothetical protein